MRAPVRQEAAKLVRALLLGMSLTLVAGAAAAQPAQAQPADKGHQLYNSYCARCHGLNMVTSGSSFFDLRTLRSDEQDRFEQSVNQGLRAMPAWGSILKPDDVQALWAYVSTGR